MRALSSLFAMCVGLLALVVCRSGFAQTSGASTFALNWVREPGAEGCVSSQAMAQMLEQVVGPVLRQPAEAGFAIEGIIQKVNPPGGWRARLRVTNPDGIILGERELTNLEPRCSALTASVLLVLAVIIDPDAAQRGLPQAVVEQLSQAAETEAATQGENSHETPVTDPALNRPAPLPAAESLASIRRRRAAADSRSRFSLLGAWSIGTGMLPDTAHGPELGARLHKPGLGSLSLTAIYWLPQSSEIDSPRSLGGEVRFRAAQSLLAACRSLLETGALTLDGCLGASAGYRWIRAEVLANRADPARVFAGGFLGTGLRATLGSSWALFANVSASLLLPRDRVTYQDHAGQPHVIFEASTLSGWAALGVEFGP
jgi:hypothetical protein